MVANLLRKVLIKKKDQTKNAICWKIWEDYLFIWNLGNNYEKIVF